MNCSQCGTALAAGSMACQQCGTPRLGRPIDYPRDWPNSATHLDPPVQTAELLAYAAESGETWGDNSPRDYYMTKWIPLLEGRSSWAGYNWAACVFGTNWCFWRRLYVFGVLIAVAEVSAGFLVALAIVVATRTQDPPDPRLTLSGWAGLVVVRLAFGALANRIYFRRATKAIKRARTQALDAESHLSFLRRRGGTSGWGLAIAVLLSLALLILAYAPRVAAA
jgi:hypothetical protein